MKKTIFLLAAFIGMAGMVFLTSSCAVTQAVADKTGAQLWGENCLRCHNSPSPADYSDAEWATIGMHMRIRNNLTKEETDKIVAFLQTGN